jgi:hypothetical protein
MHERDGERVDPLEIVENEQDRSQAPRRAVRRLEQAQRLQRQTVGRSRVLEHECLQA